MFVTYSGVLLHPADIQAGDINILDIAHHLTNTCRFGGGLDFDTHYSVAEHSLILCNYILNTYDNPGMAKYALMHDSSEAYLGDVVSGLKWYLPDYLHIEAKLMDTICVKYGISQSNNDIVSGLDKRLVVNEAKELMPNRIKYFTNSLYRPLDLKKIHIGGRSKRFVYNEFLWMCEELGIRDE